VSLLVDRFAPQFFSGELTLGAELSSAGLLYVVLPAKPVEINGKPLEGLQL
jgi:hypothetical protein